MKNLKPQARDTREWTMYNKNKKFLPRYHFQIGDNLMRYLNNTKNLII